jgi:hypothetical protein
MSYWFRPPHSAPVPAASAERNRECDTRMWVFSDRCSDESGWIQDTKNYRVLVVKFLLVYVFYCPNITFPKWPSWRAVRSGNCDRKLTSVLQQTYVSGSNFDPDVLFRPLTWRFSELNCDLPTATSGASWVPLCGYSEFPVRITGMWCLSGRPIKRCGFEK